MGFMWRYMKQYPGRVVMALIGSLAFVLVTVGLPTFLSYIINNAIIPGSRERLYTYVIGMFILIAIGFSGQILSRYFVSNLANTMVRDIRNDIFDKIQRLSFHEFQELGVPSLTTRITTDAFILMQFSIMLLSMGLTAPIMIVASVSMIFNLSLDLGLQVLTVVPLILLIIFIVVRLTLPLSKQQQTSLDHINRIQRENITGLRVIRAFNREPLQEERFEDVNSAYRGLSTRLFQIVGSTQPAFALLIHGALALVIWFGAQQIATSALQVGDLVAFIEYVFEALFSFTLFSNIFMMYPRAQVSANRLQEIFNTPITIQSPENGITETDGSGTLEFRHVDFSYPDADEPVLRDISFTSKAGETVAFIGSTGSGKSTIVKLIPRFYDVTKGQILLDGVDLRDMDLDVLRDKIGYTPQRANLFTGDIADNLRYGKENADQGDLQRATDVSQASEFISRTPAGYETYLAEGGSNLSGGQKQRLSIARSVIGDHEVYIFDDSFSALDYKTDATVRSKLARETANATTVIVAQRVSTIMHADQIIVLDHGRIAAKGTHKELLETSDLYYEIASSQLSEEELKHA
ncbi:MAG: ABC transporter ATP-binding protein [Aerococcus sp.]|nr:ABC transporter ATP-binding protein [Aerococcus sp.]